MSPGAVSHQLNAPRCLARKFQRLARQARPAASCRGFSNAATLQRSRYGPGRKMLFSWLNRQGHVFRRPQPGSTNYLSAYDASGRLIRVVNAQEERKQQARMSETQGENEHRTPETQAKDATAGTVEETEDDLRPFPWNRHFVSEAVLSEPLRDEIYKRVVEKGQTVREVSINLGVTMERVGAVIRLRTVEQDWIRQDKPRATFYQRAILGMLPQTAFDPNATDNRQHESINDLAVHPSTLPQIFHPTSESRHFTREDAGRVFKDDLLPADKRVPHPELIEAARDKLNGMSFGARQEAMQSRLDDLNKQRMAELQKEKEDEEKKITTIPATRWDFRFRNISVDEMGRNERSRDAVGHRYGMPHEDRKKGLVKIPTKVE